MTGAVLAGATVQVLSVDGVVQKQLARTETGHSQSPGYRRVNTGLSCPVLTLNQGKHHSLHIGKSPYTDPYLLSDRLSFPLPLFPNLKIQLCRKLTADLSQDLFWTASSWPSRAT
jgi:hypothetical protein